MGVSSPTLDEQAAVFGSVVREQSEVSEAREVVRRFEAPRSGTQDRDPLTVTLRHLSEQAPSSRHLERIARALIRTTLGPRYDEMNAKRSQLISKEFDGTLTPSEHSRLDYLTWQLEQVEEALLGDQWDVIQSAVAQQATLARDMQDFIDELKATTPSAFRSRK